PAVNRPCNFEISCLYSSRRRLRRVKALRKQNHAAAQPKNKTTPATTPRGIGAAVKILHSALSISIANWMSILFFLSVTTSPTVDRARTIQRPLALDEFIDRLATRSRWRADGNS